MNHTISNDCLQVRIQSKGAELSSIQSKKTGIEYIWQADPTIWASHAPVLFPIIGLLKENSCTINGSSFQIPKHGFVRHNENLKVIAKTSTSISLQLEFSIQTLKMYPYKFKFVISFELKDNQLVVSHLVQNNDSDNIFFSLGAHPGFNCPLHKGANYSDYYLEFEHSENEETVLISDKGLVTNETRPILNGHKLKLRPDLFDDDALIFRNLASRKVSLKSAQYDEVVTVEYQDFPYLGIWAKPNAPFVCIEPWLGIADHEDSDGDFLKKEGLLTLPKGEIFRAKYAIFIEE